MRIDKDGMTYKGQRIEDGGEAHRAFLEVTNALRPWKCKHCEHSSRTMWGMQLHQTMRHLDPLGYMAELAPPDDRQANVSAQPRAEDGP